MGRTAAKLSKRCAACSREFTWRRKWAHCWSQVSYCSDRCRRRRTGPADRSLESAILSLLAEGQPGATICPSEAARLVRPADWRPWLERTRSAARRLAARGEVEVLQRGRVVDPAAFRGPVRLRRVDP